VQIGITPFLTFSGLGEAFNWFRHRYRNVQLNVIEGLMFQARQRIVVREGHPMQKKPTARGLAACEWVLTQPIGGGQQPRIEAMFSLAGVAPPSRVVVCEALSAMALMRATDVVGIVPEPLLGHFESSGIVPVREAVFHPCDIELLILTRSDVPLTPAAEYFVHCLSRVSSRLRRRWRLTPCASTARLCRRTTLTCRPLPKSFSLCAAIRRGCPY
jgi:LysR family transcriptional regulator of abg operon